MTSSRQLRATGWSRYFDAVFLTVWLLFWVVGEVVVLALIGGLLASAVSAALGHPLALASRVAPTDGSVSFFLLFLLGWISLWTLGGIAASGHLLRQLAGVDRVELTEGALRLEWCAGPLRRRRAIPLATIHRLRMRPHTHAVVVDTAEGTRVVAELGTVEERRIVQAWLLSELRLPDPDALLRLERNAAPHDRDVRTDAGTTIVTHPRRRHHVVMMWVAWGVVALLSLGWINALGRRAPAMGSGEWAACVLTVLVAIAAAWVTGYESTWRLSPGALQMRRRWGGTTLRERQFDASAHLEVEYERDSDGDDRYRLVVRDEQQRQVLTSALDDPYELLALGEWLSAQTALPFTRLNAPVVR